MSQACDQLQQAVDDGLVEQVDEQRLATAPAEKTRDAAVSERAWQARFSAVRTNFLVFWFTPCPYTGNNNNT